jgi:hypothetical protein
VIQNDQGFGPLLSVTKPGPLYPFSYSVSFGVAPSGYYSTSQAAVQQPTHAIHVCLRGIPNAAASYLSCGWYPVSDTWQINQWFSFTWTVDQFLFTASAYVNGRLVGTSDLATGNSAEKWSSWLIGTDYTYTQAFGTLDAQMAQVDVWNRTLLPWEIALIGLDTPPNISPVQFLVKPSQNLAVGWGYSTDVAIAQYISFGTDPILTAQITVLPGLVGGRISDSSGVTVPQGQQFHMESYFSAFSFTASTGYLTLIMTAPVFTNAPGSGVAPAMAINFTLSGDTEHFAAPSVSSTSVGISALLAYATMTINPNVPTLNAGFLPGPSNTTGTRVVDFTRATQFLDLYNKFDVNNIAPMPAVFPSTITTKKGMGQCWGRKRSTNTCVISNLTSLCLFSCCFSPRFLAPSSLASAAPYRGGRDHHAVLGWHLPQGWGE